MTKAWIIACCSLAAVNGGVFFAFSNFVMRALHRLGPSAATDTMRSINVVVITPSFMTILFGTGVAGLITTALAFRSGNEPWLVLTAALIFLVGCNGVTAFGNVPLNNAIAASPPMAWSQFYPAWSKFNHVRTVACLLSSAIFAIAALRSN